MKSQAKVFLFCIVYDIFDLVVITPLNAITLGVAGFLYDLVGCFVAFKYFGKLGLINLLEVIDFGNMIEGFIPTMTLTFLLTKITKI